MNKIKLILIAGLATLLACGSAWAETINVHTTGIILDINPLNEKTPALQWAGNLLAHKLFRAKCRDNQANIDMEAECIHHSNRMHQGVISLKEPHYNKMNFCHFKRGAKFATDRNFLFNSVKVTLQQISKKVGNTYFGNGLVYHDGSNPELVLRHPQGLDEDGARYLDFPLLKNGVDTNGVPVDLSAPIPPRSYEDLNAITFGKFKLIKANNQFLEMVLRDNYGKYCRGTSCNPSIKSRVTRIKIKSSPFMQDILNRAIHNDDDPSIASKPHVILNVNAIEIKAVPNRMYAQIPSNKGNGQFYLGLNYRLTGVKGDLFSDPEFRRYLAQSFWGTSVLKRKMVGLGGNRRNVAEKGEWFGQTFRGLLYPRRVDRLKPAKLADQIQSYLIENKESLGGGVNIRIVLTKEARRLLAPVNIKQLKVELNRLWKCDDELECNRESFYKKPQINFVLTEEGNGQVAKRDFDLVIDKLTHGNRLRPIVDFLTPGHDGNILGLRNEHIDADKLRDWRDVLNDVGAYREINEWLAKNYYVIMLGQLPVRDLYYKPMIEPAQKLYCGSNGKLELPFGVLKWNAPVPQTSR